MTVKLGSSMNRTDRTNSGHVRPLSAPHPDGQTRTTPCRGVQLSGGGVWRWGERLRRGDVDRRLHRQVTHFEAPQMIRPLLIRLMLLVGAPSLALAASFDCDRAATETEIAICADPELSALDELASAFSPFIGLQIDLTNIPQQPEYISDDPMAERLAGYYSDGIERLMGLLALSDLKGLSAAINDLPSWDAALFSNDKVMIIRAEDYVGHLQDGIIVFSDDSSNPDRRPVFYDFETHINALSTTYNFVDDIIIREIGNRRVNDQEKYRNQDGCWRLIGAEWEELFNSGLAAEVRKQSVNLLVGRMVETFYSGQERQSEFVPSVVCLSESS